jgi:hypothetical protein
MNAFFTSLHPLSPPLTDMYDQPLKARLLRGSHKRKYCPALPIALSLYVGKLSCGSNSNPMQDRVDA